MIITKNNSKNGKQYVNLIFSKKDLKDCKNTDFSRVSFSTDWNVGLDDKTSKTIAELFNLAAIPTQKSE